MLEAELGRGVAGLQARIAYDPKRGVPGHPELTERARGFELAANDTGEELILLIYSVGGQTLEAGGGPLVRIPLRTGVAYREGDPGLELAEVLVADVAGMVRRAKIGEATVTALPVEFRLSTPYPNPLDRLNGTKLDLEIPEALSPALSGDGSGIRADGAVRVIVDVYNVRGQRVRQLTDAYIMPGTHTLTWDARNDNGGRVAVGLYVLRLRAGDFVTTRKLIVGN
jgi:hypothetical protein